MSESANGQAERADRARKVDVLIPFRVASRLTAIFFLTLFCGGLSALGIVLGIFSRPLSERMRKAVGRAWARHFGSLLHIRFKLYGTPPEPPYFVVLNHLSWMDFFAVLRFFDATAVVEEPVSRIPVVGTIIKGLRPIFVRRVKEDTQRVKALMVETLRRGENLVMAPESPIRTLRMGTGVQMFRGGLVEAAVLAQKPVHYFTVTYRTPEGYPPASQVLLSGPNPFLKSAFGEIPASEFEMCGPERPFMLHLMHVLALPYFDFDIRFGKEPIPPGDDRIVLANRLHEAVSAAFVPLL